MRVSFESNALLGIIVVINYENNSFAGHKVTTLKDACDIAVADSLKVNP